MRIYSGKSHLNLLNTSRSVQHFQICSTSLPPGQGTFLAQSRSVRGSQSTKICFSTQAWLQTCVRDWLTQICSTPSTPQLCSWGLDPLLLLTLSAPTKGKYYITTESRGENKLRRKVIKQLPFVSNLCLCWMGGFFHGYRARKA